MERRAGSGPVASAIDADIANVDVGAPDSCPWEMAQQVSACAWLTRLLAPGSSDAEWCIGHVSESAQQAIRASGVASQPAHAARFPTHSVKVAASAARRCARFSTPVRCPKRAALSIRHREPGAGALQRVELRAVQDADHAATDRVGCGRRRPRSVNASGVSGLGQGARRAAPVWDLR